VSTNVHESENVTVKLETAKALLCVFDDATEKWIPKSVIHDDSEVYKWGTEGTLVVKQWFAEQEELP
jgi:hypothetical protein